MMISAQKELIQQLNTELSLDLPERLSLEDLKKDLFAHINELIQNQFQKLVALLYRIDVDELKLKTLLEQNTGSDAASIITDLIIERQVQKIKSRQQFRQQDDNNIDENEKW